MNILQFLTILWARRVLIGAATVSCLVGALVVCALLPPRWESTARVVLNDVKPDVDTGQVISGASMRFYITTQESLITDYTVAGRVAEQIGWLSDPDLIAQYQRRPAHDQRDFRHFLADLIIQGTKVALIPGTNIIEITYAAGTSAGAQAVADALRKSYITASLDLAHQDAMQNVNWYTQQMVKAKQALDDAVKAESDYERANGIVMQDKGVDVESAHLESLSQQAAPAFLPNPPDQQSTSSAFQLATVEASLASATKTLGPNNPEVVELRTKQAALATLVARDRANAQAAATRALEGGAKVLEQSVAAQQQKVIAHSEQIGRLNQLHQDVLLRQAEYKATSEKVSHFREQANSGDAGVTSLGNALTPSDPTFPNYLLIAPGGIILGLGVGVLVSLLLELLGRRIRTVEDLDLDDDIPLICVVPWPSAQGQQNSFARGWSRLWAWWPSNRGAVRV